MRSRVNRRLLATAASLAILPGVLEARDRSPQTMPAVGAAADYPVVVGEPYTIGTTTWVPADQLNYDAVGQAVVGSETLIGVSGAHKTLPLPSYVEVTSLETGRTIVVRVVERGPMTNQALLALSAQAATQLGAGSAATTPVRVRRVNPPEVERAALRSGGPAPERMATPDALLKVLRRKLAEQSPSAPPPSTPPAMPTSAGAAPVPSTTASGKAAPVRVATPEVAAKATARPVAASRPAKSDAKAAAQPQSGGTKGRSHVQVAAFSTEDRARKVAGALGGSVSRAGSVWRVRMGPFATGDQAAAALEKARGAGYRDARIQRAD